jgi:hypothetical protein
MGHHYRSGLDLGRTERERVVSAEVSEISTEASPLVKYTDKLGEEVAFSLLPGSIGLMNHFNLPRYLDKEDAIDMAQRILRAYEVPFCNRIEKAGTVG